MATATNRNHGLMDIKPVTRSSLAFALGGTLLYFVVLLLFLRWVGGPLSRGFMIGSTVVISLVVLFELRAFHARTRQENGVDMTIYGATCQGSAVVEAPIEKVPLVVLTVCRENPEFGLTENNPTGGKISTGVAFSSWGERIQYSVRSLSATESEVTATCRPASPFALTNWGRSEKNLYTFLRAVHETPAQAVSVHEGA